MSDLTSLPNIGPVLAQKLNQIAITSYDQLAEMGSIETVLRLDHTDPSACYNMLYALEGAILGVRWHRIPKDQRAALRSEFDNRRNT